MCQCVEVQVLHWPEDARYRICAESSFKLTKCGMHQPSANSFPPYAIGVCVCVCVCMCTYVCAEEDIPVASDIAQQPVGDLFLARTRFESPSVGSTTFVAHTASTGNTWSCTLDWSLRWLLFRLL